MYTYLDEVTIQDERALNILFVYTAILDPNLDLGVEIYTNRDTSYPIRPQSRSRSRNIYK